MRTLIVATALVLGLPSALAAPGEAAGPELDDEEARRLRERRYAFEVDAARGRELHEAGFAWTAAHAGFVLIDLLVQSVQPAVAAPFEIGEAIAMGVWTPFGVGGWASRGTARALSLEPDDQRLVQAVIVHRKRAAAEGLLYVAGVTGATAGVYWIYAGGVEAACANSEEGRCNAWSIGWHRMPPVPWSVASATFLASAGLTALAAEIDGSRFGVDPRARSRFEAVLLPVIDPRGGVRVVVAGRF